MCSMYVWLAMLGYRVKMDLSLIFMRKYLTLKFEQEQMPIRVIGLETKY